MEQRVGLWNSSHYVQDDRAKEERRRDLRGIEIVATAENWKPFIFLGEPDDDGRYPTFGLFSDVTRELAKIMNFSVNVSEYSFLIR